MPTGIVTALHSPRGETDGKKNVSVAEKRLKFLKKGDSYGVVRKTLTTFVES